MNPDEIRRMLVRMQSDRSLAHAHRLKLRTIVEYIDELEAAVKQHYEKVLELEKQLKTE